MGFDEIVLACQRVADRLARRLLGKPGRSESRRRFVVVQIDGLPRAVLERAITDGHMPFTRRLLARGTHRAIPMSVGLPSSTPAFQMSLMYGVRPDIPGFHYHDKRRRQDIHFPRAGHAAHVEAEHTAGIPGVFEGGSTYGCVFTGGAANSLFSFARLKSPTADGVLRVASSGLVLLWVLAKGLTLTAIVLLREALRPLATTRRARHHGWRWLIIKLGLSVWVREFFTLATSRDVYRGVPAVYVNYLDYDVSAHAFGPTDRLALRSLRRVDAAIRRIARVIRRVPEYRYDLFILSDHGQALCRPFVTLTGGVPFERALFQEFFGASAPRATPRARGLRPALTDFRARERGVIQRFVNYFEEEFPWRLHVEREAAEGGGLRVVAAGPNAFIYFLDAPEPLDAAEIERRHPGLPENLSTREGVGFVLARSADGPLCWSRGKRYRLALGEAGPFEGREDTDLVLDGLRELMAMRSAGDLVIYGIDAPGGHVSYIHEIGAHAGTSPEEMQTFLIHPVGVPVGDRITHPRELHPLFMRYREVS